MSTLDLVFNWTAWLQLNLPDAKKVYGMDDEWLVLCPFHADRNPSCAVNTAKACFVCRSCGAKGSLQTLRKKVGGESPDVEVSVGVLLRQLEEAMQPAKELPRYVDSWLERYSPDNGFWTEVRGLLPETVERYRLRVDMINRDAIIPVYWQGSLRGVIKRRMGPQKRGEPKYKFPKHLPRRELLWGYDEAVAQVPHGPIVANGIFGANPVVLTEGQVDAMSVAETGVRAVALGGNLLLKMQRVHLRRLSPTAVIVGLDSDLAGIGRARIDKQNGPTGVFQVAMMCHNWVPVYVVDWDPHKDAGDVRNIAERTSLVLNALPYRAWRKGR